MPFGSHGRSVLDLADACDVPTRWSCGTGVCHTCITPLLSGGITYSPDPLERPADGQVLVCCAQPSTEIVLDMSAAGQRRRQGTGVRQPGTDPQRRDYASFADFADPDGNTSIIQEIGHARA